MTNDNVKELKLCKLLECGKPNQELIYYAVVKTLKNLVMIKTLLKINSTN